MSKEIFLLDANIFLTPSREFYRFSIAPSFWEQINIFAQQGYIKTIDKIEKELRPRKKEEKKDDIQLWYENTFKGEVINTKTQDIVDEYQKIINHLYSSKKYSKRAFHEWSYRDDIGDPWLVATAKIYDYTVVSFEKAKNYNGGTPLSSAKIPNVCQDLNVKHTDLFNMMERLGIKL